MRICAVILDYRGAGKTRRALLSLVSQGITRTLVIDNSDNPFASRQLAHAIDTLQTEGIDYAVQILQPVTNLGFAGGVNFALGHPAAQDCDVFLLLNNDAALAPGSLYALTSALAAGNTELVAPTVVNDDGILQPVLWYHRFFGLQTSRAMPGSFLYLSGCCLLFKRTLCGSGKLLDEDFFMYGEDALLGWRMQQEQKSFLQISNASVRHTGQAAMRQCSFFYEYHMARAHALLALKARRHALEVPLLVMAKCGGILLRALLRSLRYRSAIPLLACGMAWFPVKARKN